jgi:hypothetical protein
MEKFITECLDPGLVPYMHELEKAAVTSENTLRYLRPREVQEMQIPTVFKRLIISKIIALQTPERREKMKKHHISPDTADVSVKEMSSACPPKPKKLNFDVDGTQAGTTSMSITGAGGTGSLKHELERINDEKESLGCVLTQKLEELGLLKSVPAEQPALAIPGVAILKSVCDNCHHRGHRISGNKGNKDCPFAKCPGFHYCGLLVKHKEHRNDVTEVSTKAVACGNVFFQYFQLILKFKKLVFN